MLFLCANEPSSDTSPGVKSYYYICRGAELGAGCPTLQVREVREAVPLGENNLVPGFWKVSPLQTDGSIGANSGAMPS